MLAGHNFFHPFTFNLYVSLYLKWVSYRHHIVGSCFLLTLTISILICIFRPLILKVITDIVGLISTIFVIVLYLLPLFFVLIFVFYSFCLFFLAMLCSLWDLSSLTRDRNLHPCSANAESLPLDHWTKESEILSLAVSSLLISLLHAFFISTHFYYSAFDSSISF